MSRARYLLMLVSLTCSTATAQELTLRQDCESGFRRLIHSAQEGELGETVTNANVSVDGKRVVIELVRRTAPNGFLRLIPKQSTQTASRYFDIIPVTDASPSDVASVGRALNAAFSEDPFTIVSMEGMRGDDPIPGVWTAWQYGGWHGVARVLERRTMVLASVQYTVAVIVALAVGVFASVALLWTSLPPDVECGAQRRF